MTDKKIRVAIVDDSLFMRAAIKKILDGDPRFEVVAVCKDGAEAVDKVTTLAPDVVTMDYNMPRMNGAEAVRAIMAKRPTPVLMLSAHTRDGAKETLEALSAGAMDFLAKPSGEVSADFHKMGPQLVEKLVHATQGKPRTFEKTPVPPRPTLNPAALLNTWPPGGARVVVIGISTGGPSALTQVVPALPADAGFAMLIVQHMPAQFTAALAERLDALSGIEVREAKEGERPRQGIALLAPGDRHLEVGDNGVLHLSDGPPVNNCRPSADVTMKGAAKIFGRRAIGLLMTGMGRDGAEGLAAIKAAGGHTFAQDRDSCVIWGMPRAAVEMGVVDEELPLDQIAPRLSRL
jgi:two-component system chemotaxis response regulator CheB